MAGLVKRRRWLGMAVAVAAFPPLVARAQAKALVVFAAASLKNALDEIATAWAKDTSQPMPRISYAASSALAKQIEQGAPADVFVSADTDWMDYAIKQKTINEPTRVNLLGNSIVLIAPKDSKIDNVAIGPGFDLAKLAGDGRIATGDVRAVPYATRDSQSVFTCSWSAVSRIVVTGRSRRSGPVKGVPTWLRWLLVLVPFSRAGVIIYADRNARGGPQGEPDNNVFGFGTPPTRWSAPTRRPEALRAALAQVPGCPPVEDHFDPSLS